MSLVIIFLIFSCRKNPPSEILPSITETGEHTLGFFINGEPWIPYDRGNHEVFELPKPTLETDGALKISATRIDDSNSARNWFCIEIEKNCFNKGIYPLSNHLCTSPYHTFYYATNKDKSARYYQIDTLQPHFIEITHLDTVKQIIAGRFEFDAVSNQKDTITIRSGRFDLIYE